MATVRPSFLVLLLLFPFLVNATTTEFVDFSVVASVSNSGTELSVSSSAIGLEFSREGNSQCPDSDSDLCVIDPIESTTFSDNVLTSERGAKYSFGLGWHQKTDEISVNGLPAMNRHEAIYFNDRFWVYPPSGQIWSSADGVNWLNEGVQPEIGRYMAELVEFNGRLFLIGGSGASSNEDDVWVSDNGYQWELLLDGASFGGRYGHAVTVFDDRIWLVGGRSGTYPGSPVNDVWSSVDGVNWVLENSAPGFSARLGHTLRVFNNQLFLVAGADTEYGGFSDVWSSTDGVDWVQQTPDAGFSGRSRHESVVYDGRLWVVGGDEGFPVCDVWSSENGADWVRETEDTGSFSCARQRIVQKGDGAFYSIGGQRADRHDTGGVWYSWDLANWTQRTRDNHFTPRSGHALVAFADRLWVIGGDAAQASAEIWSSTDGVAWYRRVAEASFGPRAEHDVLVFADRLWLIGENESGDIDVWSSADAETWVQELEVAPFVTNKGVQAAVHEGELYALTAETSGGVGDPVIWSSPDGINWTQKNVAAPFGYRLGTGLVSFAGKLFVIGGRGRDFKNDIWSSPDGVVWTEEAATASFDPRAFHKVKEWQGKLWLAGGQNQQASEKYVNDVWASDDGVSWAPYAADAGFGIRGHHGLEVFDDRLWVIGGTGYQKFNDSWSSADGIEWVNQVRFHYRMDIEYADISTEAINGRITPSSTRAATGSSLEMNISADDGYQITSASGCGGTLTGDLFHIDEVSTDCTVTAEFDRYYFVFAASTAGGSIAPVEVQRVLQNDTTSFVVSAEEGYELEDIYGCSGTLNGTTYTTSGISDDCYVVALFERKTYPLTLTPGAHGRIVPVDSLTPAHGDVTRLHIIPDPGYTIVSAAGCDGQLDGSLFTTGVVTSSCDVTASFEPEVYTIDLQGSSGGSLSLADGTTGEFGTQAVINTEAEAGYELASIMGCGGMLQAGVYTTGSLEKDCTVSAIFSKINYPVALYAGEHGKIMPIDTLLPAYGEVARLHILPDEGYDIAEVEGCGGELAGPVYTTTAITEACAVTATFRPQVFDISLDVSQGGTLAISEEATREFGSEVVFSVSAEEGYELRSISGCGGALNESGDYVISELTGHCELHAYFGLRHYDVTITVTSGGDVVYTGGTLLPHRAQQDVLLVPDVGFDVESVSGCNGSLEGLIYTIAPESDCEVDVVFRSLENSSEEPGDDEADAGGALSVIWLTLTAIALGFRRRRSMRFA